MLKSKSATCPEKTNAVSLQQIEDRGKNATIIMKEAQIPRTENNSNLGQQPYAIKSFVLERAASLRHLCNPSIANHTGAC